jgi:precorrin-6B methylase 2
MHKPEFVYTDGGEQRLLELFTEGHELQLAKERQQPSNWPLLYHLSPARANVVRFLQLEKADQLDVLELGAGCGAITEYLVGLEPHVSVTAVEGDKSRADVIRLRCGKADNLSIVNVNISDFKSDKRYDLVLVIGVLEYSGAYVNKEEPYTWFLEHAKTFLKPNGRLIVAIENQLGHKYIAGLPEDHYGSRFEGLANYPHYNGVRTFTKTDLAKMLVDAGFTSQQWFYPFPDYKLPDVVLSEDAFRTTGFDWMALLEFPSKDPVSQTRPSFSEKELLQVIQRNCDATVFMNSFIIVATAGDMAANRLLAYKNNHNRAKAFETSKWFTKEDSGAIQVRTVNVASGAASVEEYHRNYSNLNSALVDAIYRKDSKTASLLFSVWERQLRERLVNDTVGASVRFHEFVSEQLGEQLFVDEIDWLPCNAVDLTPRNILLNRDTGAVQVIDLEWDLPCEVPFSFVVCRGLLDLNWQVSNLLGDAAADRVAAGNQWWEDMAMQKLWPPSFRVCCQKLDESIKLTVWFFLHSLGRTNTQETRNEWAVSMGFPSSPECVGGSICARLADQLRRQSKSVLRKIGRLQSVRKIAQAMIAQNE